MTPALAFDRQEYERFLNAFLGKHASKLGGQYIQFVHISDTKRIAALSCHADSPKFLKRALEWHKQMGGLYISMGLRTTIFDPDRGKEPDMSGLVAFFCEIDVYGPGWHKGHDNLPLTIEAAEDLVRTAFPNHPPSMVVGSGGGIYIYWLLEDPWIFANEEERTQAMAILDGIFHALFAVAHAQGLHVDNVADLARVLRLPGSVNFKIKTNPRQAVVRMLNEDLRYTPAQFAEIAAAAPVAKDKKKPAKKAKPATKGEKPEGKAPEVAGEKDYPPSDSGAVIAGCPFLQHCRDHADNLAEPDWLAMISIIARCEDGDKHVHELSSPYPGYDHEETERKIAHCLENVGPHLCTTIEGTQGDEFCGTCPNKGKIKSPIVLGRARLKLDPVAELNRDFAVIRTKNGCCILHEITDPLTGFRDFDLLNGQSFALQLSNRKVVQADESGMPKSVPLLKVWLESPRRREYPGGVVMDPARTTDPLKCFNMFNGLAFEPKLGDWSLFKEHIRKCIAGGDQKIFEFIIAWVADLLQHPGGPRFGTALALIGKQGTGKGLFANNIGKLLGVHYVTITDPAHLTGRFNHHLACCLLCFVDEAIWANDKAAEGVLKARITEPTMLYEAKGRDPFPIANHARFIIASNNPHVVPAGCDERRFLVVTVSEDHRQDHKYFAAMQDQMQSGGYEAMLFDLLQMDLRQINLRQAPRTATLLDQIMHSLPPVQKFWLDCLHRGGSFSASPDSERSFKDDLSWAFGGESRSIPPRVLYTDYLAWVSAAKIRYPGCEDAFYKDVRKLCSIKRVQRSTDGAGRQWVYELPSLAECRAQFEEQVNLPVRWFDEESSELDPAPQIGVDATYGVDVVDEYFNSMSQPEPGLFLLH